MLVYKFLNPRFCIFFFRFQNHTTMATKNKSSSYSYSSSTSSMLPDWSLLPEELLQIVTKNVENCFDVVHARSVCNSWQSTFPFPSCLLRPSYSLPQTSLSKAKTVIQGNYNFSTNHKSNDKLNQCS